MKEIEEICNKLDNFGAESLNDEEALKFMLSYILKESDDLNVICESLLAKFGTYHAVFDATYEELLHIPTLSQTSALSISLLKQIKQCVNMSYAKKKWKVNETKYLIKFFKIMLENKEKEELYIISIDKNGYVGKIKRLGAGKKDHVEIDKKDLFDFCTLSKAKTVAIAHNHPKATCEPSREDDINTDSIKKQLNSIGVMLADHIIIGIDGSFSFMQGEKFNNI